MTAIYRKEMRSYLCGMFGWFIMAIFLFFMGLFTVFFNLMSGIGDFSYPLVTMQWVLIVMIPLLTMRSIAEERHTKTDQLLYSLPIRLREVVLGKFFAMLTLFLLPTAVSALYPLILSSFGTVSLAAAYTALFGYILLGAALIAVCTFVSSLVENQILAAVLSIAAVLLIYMMSSVSALFPESALVSFLFCVLAALGAAALLWAATKNINLTMIAAVVLVIPVALVYIVNAKLFTSLVPDFLSAVDLFSRYSGFSYGHFDIAATVFYLSFVGFFLFLTVRSMEKRRLM